ncbi:MAG: radical SAM protein [Planctomycetes bacterium]|nr:radical SAM protein [Planctomycetota bacterium]
MTTSPPDLGTSVPRLDTIHFNSTKTCNLGCAFCYDNAVRGRTELLPLETVRQIATDAVGLGCRRVILSGGEPLSRPDWQDVASIFDGAGMEVSLATNGTLITAEAARFLAGLRHVTLSISLDGDRETHDRLRAQDGAHARTMRGLRHLQEAGVEFDLNATISRDNIRDVAFLTKVARDFECDVRFSLLHPNGRGKDMDGGRFLEPAEILLLREYCHVARRRAVPIFLNLPPLLQYVEEIIPGRGAACGWAVNFCGVLANGDVTICGVASSEPHLVAGNVLERPFREIWADAPLFRETRSFQVDALGGICGRCAFREICGGACRLSAYRAEGDFLAPYELCQRFYDEGLVPERILDPVSEPASN